MDTRATLALSLVIVVLLAGCSGLVGNGGSESTDAFEYPEGFSADGVNSSDKALDTHRQAVIERNSYRADQQFRIETQENETVVDVAYRVDFDAETAIQRSDFNTTDGEGSLEFYYEADRRIARSVSNGEATGPSTQNWTFSAENQTATEAVAPLLRSGSSYEATPLDREGDQLVRFEATSLESPEEFFAVTASDNVTSFNASFVLDSDGVIHAAAYELSVGGPDNKRTISMTFEASGFGETSVDRPEWASDA